MKRLILSLVAVGMLSFMAVPAMAAHGYSYYNDCYDYYPTRRVTHYRTYAPRRYYGSSRGHYGHRSNYGHRGHYGGHYGGHGGFGISTGNFSFFLGH